ncbi:acyl-CoA thioester hydrolase [Solimonas aquatica]|uniref:Acyl-CoA thioester hydrolase n=1 Tax=Solimonas aquatica TaxID=489703 RepID=A0A1H9HGP5_9GAMM|nr:tol-pal system-associated acyl-CoA thioesterase [Solimonas aquatica]SEQ61454.1 acyl-CoA thioester hydrolase [Solimonas aquatica]
MSQLSSLQLRVYYEDTDASGVVYHANYLRYFERGRTEWLRAHGYDQQALMREQNIAFTLAELQIRYRLPARLDDRLQVQTEVSRLGRASLQFAQRVLRQDGVLLCEAQAKVGCVDAQRFAPLALPSAMLDRLRGAELAD